MFDRSACTKACVAADAHVDLVALAALAALLRHVLDVRLAPSKASAFERTGSLPRRESGRVRCHIKQS
jgi:hypothetical protein